MACDQCVVARDSENSTTNITNSNLPVNILFHVASIVFLQISISPSVEVCVVLKQNSPNVVVELFVLLPRIRQVSGSDLSLETGYPN